MITRAWRVLHLPPHGREALLCLLCDAFTFDAAGLAEEQYLCGNCYTDLAQVPEDYRRLTERPGRPTPGLDGPPGLAASGGRSRGDTLQAAQDGQYGIPDAPETRSSLDVAATHR